MDHLLESPVEGCLKDGYELRPSVGSLRYIVLRSARIVRAAVLRSVFMVGVVLIHLTLLAVWAGHGKAAVLLAGPLVISAHYAPEATWDAIVSIVWFYFRSLDIFVRIARRASLAFWTILWCVGVLRRDPVLMTTAVSALVVGLGVKFAIAAILTHWLPSHPELPRRVEHQMATSRDANRHSAAALRKILTTKKG